MEEDDDSVGSAAFGIESSATSFSEAGGALRAPPPRHVHTMRPAPARRGVRALRPRGAAKDVHGVQGAIPEPTSEPGRDAIAHHGESE